MRLLMIGLAAVLAMVSVSLAFEIEDRVTSFTLENGMDVVVIEDHRAPVVVHMVWYKAGSADEQPGVSGVAHFLEHLLFKQTKTLEAGELSRVVAENGGSDNAFTSYDYTAYYQRVAADRLELMMRMEADRMVNLDIGPDDILTERDVIIEERNQRVETDPGSLFREQRNAALYLNHRYGVPIIGWRHEMENLDLEDALAYYRTYYAPNNATLVVAGDVDPSQVRQLAQTYYGVIPPNPDLQPRERPQEPPHKSPRRMTFKDPRVSQPYVMRSYLAPERDPGDQRKAAALTLFAEVLGGGQTSILTQKLQFEQQVAVYTGAFYSGLSLDDSSFGLVIVPRPDVSLEEAEQALDQVVLDVLDAGIDPVQLARIKRQFKASDIYRMDSTEGLANSYGAALSSGLTLEDIHAWPDIIQSITPEEIVQTAKEVLDINASVTGYLLAQEEAGQ